jgi:hypothetical protein
MTAAAFMAGCVSLTNKASWRRYDLSAGAQYDRRVNREGQASAGVLTDLQGVRQYIKALTDSGQLANFQSLTPG